MKKSFLFILICLLLLCVSCDSNHKTSVGDVTIDASNLTGKTVEFGSADTVTISNIPEDGAYMIIMDDIGKSKSFSTKTRDSEGNKAIKGALEQINSKINTAKLGEIYSYVIAAQEDLFKSIGEKFDFSGVRSLLVKDIKTTNGCIDLDSDKNKICFYCTEPVNETNQDFYLYAGYTHFENGVDLDINDDLYLIQGTAGKYSTIGNSVIAITDNNSYLDVKSANSNELRTVYHYTGEQDSINFVQTMVKTSISEEKVI